MRVLQSLFLLTLARVTPCLYLWQGRSGFVDRTQVLFLSDEHVCNQALNFAPVRLVKCSSKHQLSESLGGLQTKCLSVGETPSALKGVFVRSFLAAADCILQSILINSGIF